MTFNHEKLKVYQRTLSFNGTVCAWTSQWDRKHAICDQLSRAAGSMLENIAMASAAFSAMKTRSLDYAIGSSLECAACLDLARIKRLPGLELVSAEKEELAQILRMLMGLRKSWTNTAQVVREAPPVYDVSDAGFEEVRDKACDKVGDEVEMGKPLFHHETLDVYRVSISAAEAFCSSEAVSCLSNPVFRRLDDLLTSILLNIAEGNGHFSDADQARFLGTSHESAVKLAARLDLCVTQRMLPRNEVSELKVLLERVSVMTLSMVRRV